MMMHNVWLAVHRAYLVVEALGSGSQYGPSPQAKWTSQLGPPDLWLAVHRACLVVEALRLDGQSGQSGPGSQAKWRSQLGPPDLHQHR
mmetsp:Transcript_87841/g.145339  ORF Transcript_87841/g.145339 Transcript_87841/m.145339 type:complete len:88 (-) Transcript_87841:98-361(-)